MKKLSLAICFLVLAGIGCEQVGAKNTVRMSSGLAFDLPQEWKILEITEQDVRIQTDDEPYMVVETIGIQSSGYEVEEEELIEQTDDAKIYIDPCGGAFSCYKVVTGEDLYSVVWKSPESTQPTPDNLDGIWIPDVNFDRDDILDIMKTFRIEN